MVKPEKEMLEQSPGSIRTVKMTVNGRPYELPG